MSAIRRFLVNPAPLGWCLCLQQILLVGLAVVASGRCPFLSDGVVVVDSLTAADAETHWAGEDEEQARRFGWYPKRSSLEGVREFLDETERQWRMNGARRTFAIRDPSTRALLGGCEARLQDDGSAHVSWWIFPEYRHRGFASRAVRLMIRWMAQTLGVRTFVAFIEPDNLASRGVARNVGFVELDVDLSGERPTLRHELVIAHTLYALCGLPFAGKSTVAAEIASEVGVPIVRLDAINAERGVGLNSEPIPTDEWDRTCAEAYRRLDQTLASGSSVIFDHVNFTRAERDKLRQIAAKHGARVEIVYVPVTVDEARRRLLANREAGARYDVRDDDFEHVVTHFEPPDDEPDVIRRPARQ